MSRPLRILLLEDCPDDARLILHELRRAGFEPIGDRVETESEFVSPSEPRPRHHPGRLPPDRVRRLRALDLVQERGLEVPVIVVTGALGDEAAVECLKQALVDYLLKDRLARLGSAVEAGPGTEAGSRRPATGGSGPARVRDAQDRDPGSGRGWHLHDRSPGPDRRVQPGGGAGLRLHHGRGGRPADDRAARCPRPGASSSPAAWSIMSPPARSGCSAHDRDDRDPRRWHRVSRRARPSASSRWTGRRCSTSASATSRNGWPARRPASGWPTWSSRPTTRSSGVTSRATITSWNAGARRYLRLQGRGGHRPARSACWSPGAGQRGSVASCSSRFDGASGSSITKRSAGQGRQRDRRLAQHLADPRASGQVIGASKIARDVTAQKRADREVDAVEPRAAGAGRRVANPAGNAPGRRLDRRRDRRIGSSEIARPTRCWAYRPARTSR